MLLYQIEKNNQCPFCGKTIPYRRKIRHHRDWLEAQGCPHCGHKLRIKYLLMQEIFYAIVFGATVIFRVYTSASNVHFLILLLAECLLYTVSMLLLPFVPEDEDELQAYQTSDPSSVKNASSIQVPAEPEISQNSHE